MTTSYPVPDGTPGGGFKFNSDLADRTARRRLGQALDDLTAHAQSLRRLLTDTDVELSLSDSDRFTDAAARVTRNLAVIETLRDVRDWYAADDPRRARAEAIALGPDEGGTQ